jgi:hypothetical protein
MAWVADEQDFIFPTSMKDRHSVNLEHVAHGDALPNAFQ